jgi:RNA polymerase sigma factor (TIGR02999 family)
MMVTFSEVLKGNVIMSGDTHEVTQLLHDLGGGNRTVVGQLMPLVYEELRSQAMHQLRGERPGHTLNATALAHEAYLKLVDQKLVTWQNRAHFFAIAAQAMRRILINYANQRKAEKRGGGQPLVTFDELAMKRQTKTEDLLALDEALERLAKFNERQSKIVEYPFFGGLSQKEIAEVLGVSEPTVRRNWRLARAWLSRELKHSL